MGHPGSCGSDAKELVNADRQFVRLDFFTGQLERQASAVRSSSETDRLGSPAKEDTLKMPLTRTYEDALLDQMLHNHYLRPFEVEEKRLH